MKMKPLAMNYTKSVRVLLINIFKKIHTFINTINKIELNIIYFNIYK